MSLFSKARKYRKPSRSIDEKISLLNKELEKTGMLSEKMTTSKVYYDIASQTPAVDAVLSDVPDVGNVRANGRGNAPDIDPSDSSTWANGGDDMSWLKNPNTLAVSNGTDVTGQNIFDTPDVTGFKGLLSDPEDDTSDMRSYGGIVSTGMLGVWGTSYGVLGGTDGFTVILAAFGWPQGGANPTDRGYGGFYRTDDDATYAARVSMKNKVLSYGSAFYDANNWKSVKAWIPFNSYGVGQQWNDYTGIKRAGTETSPAKIYVDVGIYVGSSGKYESTIGTPKSITFRDNVLGDPGFFPGPIQSWLMNKLQLAKQGAEYLLDKAKKNWADNTEGVGEKMKSHWKKGWSQIKDLGKAFQFSGDFVKSVPPAARVMFDYLDTNDPDSKNFGKHTPGHPNYQGPYEAKIAPSEAQYISDALADAMDYYGIDSIDSMSQSDANKIYNYMSGGYKGGGADTTQRNNAGSTYYNIIHNLANREKAATTNEDGSVTLHDNYRFTDEQDDVSIPVVRGIVTKVASKVPDGTPGSAPYYKSETPGAEQLGNMLNMEFEMNLPPPRPKDKRSGPVHDPSLYRPKVTNESYLSEGWQSLEHDNVDKDERKRWFKEKDIQPEYPKKAPPKQVNGWHPDLVDKPIDNPTIKITKAELIRNHKLTDAEVKEWTDTINALNAYIDANPAELIHARQRYPVSDPRLAELNWKMDMQLAAADEYIDKQFPENQRLYNRLVKATKRSIKLTDPKTFKSSKGKMTSINNLMRVNYIMSEYDPADKEVKNRKMKFNKKSIGRFFRKPKKKTKQELIGNSQKWLRPSILNHYIVQ